MICEYIEEDTFCELNIGIGQQLSKIRCLNKGPLRNAVKVNTCSIDKVKILLIQFDKSNKMGTIGVAESENITSAFEYAAQKKMPVIAVVASGGVRVNEGTLALMQMAKMTAAVKQHSAILPIYMNVTGESLSTKDFVSENLYKQIIRPVEWIKTIQNMRANGIDTFYEISPKPTLAQFIKNIAEIGMEIIDVQSALINCENA